MRRNELKSFFAQQSKTLTKMKRQATDWEKILTNNMTDKELNIKKKKPVHTTHFFKKATQLKNGQDLIDIFPKKTYSLLWKRWLTVIQKDAYVVNHQRNTNQNHNEISPHRC